MLPLLVLVGVVSLGARAGAASAPPALGGLGAWAAADARLGFVATIGRRQGLWVERVGSNRPARLGPAHCGKEEQIDQLAAGPDRSWGCLERTLGNTESFYSVDLVSRSGASRHVASAGGPTGSTDPPVDSIPTILGDGGFLGYLHVAAAGKVTLLRITPAGQARRIADLADVSAPEAVAVAAGHLAILQAGAVHVYTTTGRHLATIAAEAASVAVAGRRVVVRTTTRRLAVYTLRGRLVHSYALGAAGRSAGLAASGGYAVYLGGSKALRAVQLATGTDRVVARAGRGWFFDGVSLQAPGAVVPLTTRRGKAFVVRFRFLPTAALRAAAAG